VKTFSGGDWLGAHLVYLEPVEETPHVLFLHMRAKLATPGFLNRHVLVAITFELSVHDFSLTLPSEGP
jgi:hypothetical protein